jgi:hypothetical protein
MAKDAAGSLQAELGASPPAGLAALDAAERDDLAAAVRDARRRQAVALTEALDGALNLIPRLLRGPVRRIFGG